MVNLVNGPNGEASLVVCGPNGDASLARLAKKKRKKKMKTEKASNRHKLLLFHVDTEVPLMHGLTTSIVARHFTPHRDERVTHKRREQQIYQQHDAIRPHVPCLDHALSLSLRSSNNHVTLPPSDCIDARLRLTRLRLINSAI